MVCASGGINRFKRHLAGIKGDAEHCTMVSDEVIHQMKQVLEGYASNKRKTQEIHEEQNPYDQRQRVREEEMYMTLQDEAPQQQNNPQQEENITEPMS
ncbi:hypothetical protein Tsubulata_040397 [Turnera subulata]|uniref:BED-type domain-containing protein n=1 Tax=Turnera subulata TaxID=218843 RepID=A0A9Q0F2P1_9ROSI|nr:hypothetical protein Tsubulata_040397 [Turnera subulata]